MLSDCPEVELATAMHPSSLCHGPGDLFKLNLRHDEATAGDVIRQVLEEP